MFRAPTLIAAERNVGISLAALSFVDSLPPNTSLERTREE